MAQILDQYARPIKMERKPRRRIRASYDSAQTTDDNRRLWEATDRLSANAANDKSTREILVERSRYELDNNCHAWGMVERFTEDMIGTGPRLQISIPDISSKTTRQIERLHSLWCEQINYTEKLKVANYAKLGHGEGWALEFTNPTLDPFLPQLDLKLYETEQIATPFLIPTDPRKIDGIIFDDYGNPQTYHLLKNHPGGEFGYMGLEKDDIPAASMRHWYRPTRPGQARGVPEILTALPRLAAMRAMDAEVMTAARYAACISGVLYTDQAPEWAGSDSASGDDDAFERVEVERGGLLTIPKGYKLEGMEGKQPFATYGEFQTIVNNEIGRCIQMPGHEVSGDYRQLNYSSGRLARLPYHSSIRGRRHCCKMRMLLPTLKSWLREAFALGVFNTLGELPPIAFWQFRYNWDGFQSVDPQKEANARQILLAAGLTTLAKEFAEDGEDWEEMLEQRGREQERMNDLGLSVAQALNVPLSTTTTTNEEGEETSETSQQAAAAGGVQGTALNGAQIASLMALADKVALKQYPADAAESILQAAFPLMSKALIAKFVQSLSKYTPPPLPEGSPSMADPTSDVAASLAIDDLRNDLAHEQIRAEMERRQIETESRTMLAGMADKITAAVGGIPEQVAKSIPQPIQAALKRVKLQRDEEGQLEAVRQ